MGTDNLHHKRKDKELERKRKRKKVLPYILIVCEGARTEPNYFEWYKENCKQEINVDICGEGKNTVSLVREAIAIKKKIEKEKQIIFDQVWCVFDRDSFEISTYNQAFELAHKNNIKVAYSNECFEVWYLLHFQYFDNEMPRGLVFNKLDNLMKKEYGIAYKKNTHNICELLLGKQLTAIKNAKKLESKCSNIGIVHHQNPSTSVYKLVEELNNYIK